MGTESQLKLTLSPEAMATIMDMRTRVAELGTFYGHEHQWTVEAERSLTQQLSMLLTTFFGSEALVTRDGDLSLFVTNYGPGGSVSFVYGIIWHRVRRHCEVCGVSEGFEQYHHGDIPLCDEHKWDYPQDAPEPGSWSFHS